MLKTCCRAAWAAWRSIIWSNLPITCTAVEVVKQGDHGSELFIIRSGEVTVLVSKVRHVCFPHLGWWEATPRKATHSVEDEWHLAKISGGFFKLCLSNPNLGKISNLTMFLRYLENRGFEAACWQGWQGSETRGQPEGMSWTIMNLSMHWTRCCNSSTKILAKLNWDGWFLLCTCL